jgi:hypothetical protein
LAVIVAAIAIFQSAKARNLATVVEVTRQLSAEREKAHQAKIYDMRDDEFHAFQMVHLIEQASMIVNHKWVTGQSKEFLLDWLRLEIPSLAEQPAYQAHFAGLDGNELVELIALRDKFAKERDREAKLAETEWKQAEHFERIFQRRKLNSNPRF